MTMDDLETKYRNSEISFEEFMTAKVDPSSFVVKDSPKRGRRAAKRQAELLTKLDTVVSTPVETLPTGLKSDDPILGEEANPEAWAEHKAAALTGNLATAETALAFVTAGNAYFTVRSLKTGVRYTFHVSLGKAREGYCRWCRHEPCVCKQPFFVSFLSGPENTSDYTYLGWIKDNAFSATKASARFADSTVYKAFAYVWRNLIMRTLPPQTELWHEGRCGRCGRKLTVPASIEAGIGPECACKMEGGF